MPAFAATCPRACVAAAREFACLCWLRHGMDTLFFISCKRSILAQVTPIHGPWTLQSLDRSRACVGCDKFACVKVTCIAFRAWRIPQSANTGIEVMPRSCARKKKITSIIRWGVGEASLCDSWERGWAVLATVICNIYLPCASMSDTNIWAHFDPKHHSKEDCS